MHTREGFKICSQGYGIGNLRHCVPIAILPATLPPIQLVGCLSYMAGVNNVLHGVYRAMELVARGKVVLGEDGKCFRS